MLLYSSRALAVFERVRPFARKLFVHVCDFVGGIFSAQSLKMSSLKVTPIQRPMVRPI